MVLSRIGLHIIQRIVLEVHTYFPCMSLQYEFSLTVGFRDNFLLLYVKDVLDKVCVEYKVTVNI